MTLGGLALSVGVLVDNAIVVIEVIMQKRRWECRRAGLADWRAGSRHAGLGLDGLNANRFFSRLFLEGIVKILFASLSIAVISSMAASYFAAMMVIPLFTTHFLRERASRPRKGILGWFQRQVDASPRPMGEA